VPFLYTTCTPLHLADKPMIAVLAP